MDIKNEKLLFHMEEGKQPHKMRSSESREAITFAETKTTQNISALQHAFAEVFVFFFAAVVVKVQFAVTVMLRQHF